MKSILSITVVCLYLINLSDIQAQITFSDVTTVAGLTGELATESASFNDFNNNGFADLFIINRNSGQFFENNQDGTFNLISATPSLPTNEILYVGIAGDYDNDGDLDIFVGVEGAGSGPTTQSFLYRNEGNVHLLTFPLHPEFQVQSLVYFLLHGLTLTKMDFWI